MKQYCKQYIHMYIINKENCSKLKIQVKINYYLPKLKIKCIRAPPMVISNYTNQLKFFE